MPQQDTSGHQIKTIAIEYNGATLTGTPSEQARYFSDERIAW